MLRSKWVWLLLKSRTEWLALANKVSTVDNLRRGIVLEPMFEVYILRGRDGETVKSLFLQPIFTSYIRDRFITSVDCCGAYHLH